MTRATFAGDVRSVRGITNRASLKMKVAHYCYSGPAELEESGHTLFQHYDAVSDTSRTRLLLQQLQRLIHWLVR